MSSRHSDGMKSQSYANKALRSADRGTWARGGDRRKMTSRNSLLMCFLAKRTPRRHCHAPHIRNPARCHRPTAPGLTRSNERFQPDQILHTSTQKSLSDGVRFGLGCRRFRTASCCRRARFSRSRLRRNRKSRRIDPQSSTKALNRNMGYRSPPVEGNSYVVDIKGGQHFGERQVVC